MMGFRPVVLGGVILALTGCGEAFQTTGFGLMSLLVSAGDATDEGTRTLALLDGEAFARGPAGYCVDQGASRSDDGFAVMVGCALLSGRAAIMPTTDGFITLQVGAAGTASVTGSEETLRAFLETDAGKAVLGGNGAASDVTLRNVDMTPGLVTAHFDDASLGSELGLEPRLWQGFLDLNGRMATVTVRSFARNPLGARDGTALLNATISEIRAANASIAAPDG